MEWDIAGLGNALMDALVLVEDDALIDELGMVRGTMHPIDHDGWEAVFDRIEPLGVVFESGGSCANTVCTVGLLGGRAIFCGQVGRDEMGKMYGTKLVESCGAHALHTSPTVSTGKCLSIISKKDAERTMLTDLGAAITLTGMGNFGATLRQSRIGHFEGYMLLADGTRQLTVEGMHHCRVGGGLVSFDASDPFVVVQTRDMMWSLLEQYCDLVFLNADEAEALTNEPPDKAIHTIGRRGHIRTVVVKLGAKGSWVLHDGELHQVGIRKVKAIDTTGAGDAYAGGFLYGMIRGWSPQACGDMAAAVAGLTVSQVGAVVKNRKVLDAIYQEFKHHEEGA